MMTKRNYIEIADIFNANNTDEGTVLDFVDYAKEENPRFDAAKFLDAAWAGKLVNAEAVHGRLLRTIERYRK